MTPQRWRLILNGKASQRGDVREAVAAHRARELDFGVRVTWEGGDAARHAREAVEDGVDTIIVGGGDGTLHEVCGTLADLDSELPSVGLLPLGTANDFAGGAGIPEELLGALDVVASRPALPVDLLKVTPEGSPHRWCVNLATGGFGTRITSETNPTLKKLLGGAAYLLTGLARFNSVTSAFGRFEGPDFQWSGDFLVVGLGNGRQAGGGHRLCPAAHVDDGLMDVMILPTPGEDLSEALGALLMNGQAALMETAVIARVPTLEIRDVAGLTLNLDGEPVESSSFRIEVVPGRLRIHLPENSPLLSRR